LEGRLTEEEMEQLIGSFDIIGDMAILEVPAALQVHRQEIAQAVLQVHSQVRVVACKTAGTGGPFRIRPIEVIAGPKRTVTICRESGCAFAIDLNAAYYTPRWSAERLRIARQVQPGEKIIVAFAGVGPYAVVMEKHAKPAAIVAIELNPQAMVLMRRNIELNRCQKIKAIEGDVKAILASPRWQGWADRALMPHPTEAEKFLPVVLPTLREGGLLHYYGFSPVGGGDRRLSRPGAVSEPVALAFSRVQAAAKPAGYRLELNGGRIVRPYSASLVQVVLDLEVHKMGKTMEKKTTRVKPKPRARQPKTRVKKKGAGPKKKITPAKRKAARKRGGGSQKKRS
jgi:tRNA (guanine37-N1)-methyltransferase